MLVTLANLPQHPESVPINQLVRVPGTPLAGAGDVDPLDFVRTIAAARVMIPKAHVRLSAGRSGMSDELQALAFLAGANSIFYGEKLLTTGNPDVTHDRALLARLGHARRGRRGCAWCGLIRSCSHASWRHSRRSNTGRRRRLAEAFPEPGIPTAVRVGGRLLRNFCSNDYLGLSHHPELIRAATDCMSRFGFGAGAAHLVSGHSLEHHALEQELAAFVGPRARTAVLQRLHGEPRRHRRSYRPA